MSNENSLDIFDRLVGNRVVAPTPGATADDPWAKTLAGIEGRKQKVAEAAARKQELLAAQNKTVVGRLGLDPHSVLGTAKNLDTLGTIGLARAAGLAAALPDQMNVAEQEQGLTAEDYEAYHRYKQDEAVAEQLAPLDEAAERAAFKKSLGVVTEEAQQSGQLSAHGGAGDILDPERLLKARQAKNAKGLTEEQQAQRDTLKNTPAQSTQEDQELLQQTPRYGRHLEAQARGIDIPERTVLERIESAEGSRDRIKYIEEGSDFSELGYSQDADELTKTIGDIYEGDSEAISEAWNTIKDGDLREGGLIMASTLSGMLVKVAPEIVNNKAGVAQFLADELGEEVGAALIPGVGRAAVSATNLSRSIGYFNEGRRRFIEKNGRAPNDVELDYLAGHAAAAWVLDEIGDTAKLRALKKPTKTKEQLADGGLEDIYQAGKRTTKTAVVEGSTEAAQEYSSGEAEYDPATGKEIFTSGVLGSVMGGSMAAPQASIEVAKGVGKVAVAGKNAAAARLNKEPKPVQSEQVKQAEESGDINGLTDPKKPGYAPDEAVRILVGKARAPGADTAQVEEAQAQADTIVKDLEGQVERLKKQDPALLPQRKARLQELQDAAETTEDPQEKAALGKRISALNTFIAGVEDPKQQKAVARDLEKAEAQLNKAVGFQQELQQDSVQESTPAPELTKQIQEAKDPEVGQRLVREMVARVQQAPESVNYEDVEALVSNEANALTPEQRKYLRSFSQTQQRANALRGMEGVRSNIVRGGDGFQGIEQYRTRVLGQLSRGDTQMARKALTGLRDFTSRHTAKAEAASKAFSEVQGTDNVIGLIYSNSNGWTRTTKPLTKKERQETGGLNISNNSTAIVAGMQEEVGLLKSAFTELRDAYAMHKASPVEAPEVGQAPAAETEAPTPSIEPVAAQADVPPAQTTSTTQDDIDAALGDAINESMDYGETTSYPNEAPQQTQQSEPLVDENIETSPEAQYEPVSAAPKAEAGSTAGKLNVLTDAAKQATDKVKVTSQNFSQTNLAQRFLKQSGLRKGGKRLPLVETPDFVGALNDDLLQAEPYLDRELSPEERDALATYSEVAQGWKDKIRTNLPKKDPNKPQTYFKDPVKFFMDDAGNVDENLLGAIATAAYDWVSTEASQGIGNDHKAINKLLYRDDDHPVTSEEERTFGPIGKGRQEATLQLGRQVMSILGMGPESDAPAHIQEQGAAAFGVRAMALLINEGVLQETTFTGAQMVELSGNTETYKDYANAQYHFVKPAATVGDTQGQVLLRGIKESTKGRGTLLQELLGLKSGKQVPSLSPIKFLQKRAKNSKRGIPAPLAKILEGEGHKPHYIRPEALAVWQQLPHEAKMAMAGAVDMESTQVHVDNVESQKAKNDDIRRQIENFDEFVALLEAEPEGINAPFYLNREVWKMQRVGLTDTLVNPQSSKIHRHLVSMGSWETEVDMADARSRDGFLMGLAEAYGIKTDGMPVEQALAKVQSKMQEPAIQEGVAALQAMLNGEEITPEQQQAVTKATKAGGEKYYSLEALISQAQWENAKLMGTEKFTVNLTREVDGKTNGPMFGLLQMGAGRDSDDLLDTSIMGGFFDRRSGHTQVNEWAATPGNQDLYQRTARNVTRHIREGIAKKPGRARTFAALEHFTGTLFDEASNKVTKDGRNLVKNPVTVMMFGASMSTIQKNVYGDVYDKILANIEALANDTEMTARRKEFETHKTIRAINALIGINQDPALYLNDRMSVDQLLKTSLTKEQQEGIRKTVKWSLGTAIKDTMEADFQRFIEKRNKLNLAANAAFRLYQVAYRHERNKLIQELEDSGDLPISDKTKRSLLDLNPEQQKELDRRMQALEPVMHSAFSKQEGNLANGIFLAKRKRDNSSDSIYRVDASFPRGYGRNPVTGAPSKSMTLYGENWLEIEPGVSGMILGLHSLDSFVAASTYGEQNALNVHDALITGLGNSNATAQMLNQNTFKGLLEYSVPTEMASALARVAKEFSQRYSSEVIQGNPDMAKDYQEAMEALSKQAERAEVMAEGNNQIGPILKAAQQTARGAEGTKLEALRKLVSIDQYSQPGGNYTLTQADYDAIDAREAEIVELIKVDTSAKTRGRLSEQADVVTEERSQSSRSTPWGELGQSRHAHDSEVVRFLEENPEIHAKEVLHFLRKHITSTMPKGNTRTFYERLIPALYAAVDHDLPVRYLTENTRFDEELDFLPREDTIAAYAETGDKREPFKVYVRGTDYRESRVTAETLLHEMVHAASAQALDNAAKHPRKYKELVQVREDLETLRAAAKKQVGALKEAGNTDAARLDAYTYAVSDIDEMLAVGLSDRGFQRDVLNQVQVKTNTGKNPLINGMKALISNTVKLVFRGTKKTPQDVAENGMAVLIANASMVMEQTRQQNKAKPEPKSADDRLVREMRAQADKIHEQGYMEFFDALSGTEDAANSAHQARLRDLLNNLSQSLHGPFESFRDTLRASSTETPEAVLVKAIQTGKAPFASDLVASPFDLTPQQQLAAEQIELTLRESLESEPAAYRELGKVWREAREALTPEALYDGDWHQATPDEKAAAEAQHAFLFHLPQGKGAQYNHLSRFAAVALANPELYAKLDFPTRRNTETLKDKTLGQILMTLFQRVLDMLNGKLTNTHGGQEASTKVEVLVQQLVDNEAKHRRVQLDQTLSMMDRADIAVTKMSKNVFKQVDKASKSNAFRNSRNAFVRAGASTVGAIAGDRTEFVMDAVQKTRARMKSGQQGIADGLLSEARGAYDSTTTKAAQLLREVAKVNENERMNLAGTASKVALQGFRNQGKDLSQDAKKTLTQIGLRTDLPALLKLKSLDEIEALVRDEAALDKAIQDNEASLDAAQGSKDSEYMNAAKDLAYRMVTGHVVTKNLVHNAHNIAYKFGTPQFGSVSDAKAEAVIAELDPLITLYALKYSGHKQRQQFSELLRSESNREDGGNGVRDMLKLYQQLQRQAKDTLFDGSPVSMVKGYTSEIYDPHRTMVVDEDVDRVPNSVRGQRLKDMGYTRIGEVERDSNDPDKTPKAIYVIRDGGTQRRITGTMSLSSESARGTQIGLANPQKTTAQLDKARANDVAGLAKRSRSYDPRKVKTKTHLAPIFNQQGKVTGFHYLMKENTKDMALARDNDFSSILGAMAASNFDKPTAKEQNREVVHAMHEQYRMDYHNQPERYLWVGADSTDPELRENYRLLPYDTQQEIKEVWGKPGMWVRRDVADLTFGYRKLSLVNGLGLGMSPEERNRFQQVSAAALESLVGPKAALRIRQGGDVVMTMVKEIKDFLVIKSGMVMLGNILSNVSLLALSGVANPVRLASLHREAIDNTLRYRRDSKELRELKQLQEIEYVTYAGQDIAQRIRELEDSLAHNKAQKLVEAGLMPTIVEDVDQMDDPFSYKSSFNSWVDAKTSRVWAPLRTAGKWAYMSHDTPLYQMLHETTQMSDFVARYVLYEHVTTRVHNPLSHQDAVQKASDMFINYDIPSHRVIQYLNDTGLLLFTKYYIRIQRALLTLLREHPARVMSGALLHTMMPGVTSVLNSAAPGRIGNPFNDSVFMLPEAVSEAATIQAGMSVFR